MTERVVYTVTEVALMLGLDERTVRRGCADGVIPSIRIGRRVVIPREQLDHLVQGEHASASCHPVHYYLRDLKSTTFSVCFETSLVTPDDVADVTDALLWVGGSTTKGLSNEG